MSQLTITLNDDLLRAAQEYARQHGQELDALVAQLLAEAVRPASSETPGTKSVEQRLALVRELAGSVKLPSTLDYQQALHKALDEKYGL